MKKRQWAIIGGGAVLVLAFMLNRWLAATEQEQKPPKTTATKAVEVFSAHNEAVPIAIPVDGKLQALRKIELFAEVSGVLQSGSKRFEAGVAYSKGQTLLKLNNDEAMAAYVTAKDTYVNQITQSLADIKLDYPEAFSRWNNYLISINKKRVSAPPKESDQQLNRFLTSRGIYTAYQNFLSAGVRLEKFSIDAPFDGILTEALVDPGILVRAGQPLGEFIAPRIFELEAALSFQEMQLVSIGDTVILQSAGMKGEWVGIVSRKNAKLDPATQQVKLFIKVEDERLTDGLYMQGTLEGGQVQNAVAINRNLLIDGTRIYTVEKDSTLMLQKVKVVQKGANTVVVQGVNDGAMLLKKPMAGAYEGMKVSVISQ
jgi:membrane fusion protein (multidrug efflux system)